MKIIKQSKRCNQGGYALVAALAAGIVALSLTSIVMVRMQNTTTQVTNRGKTDLQVHAAESIANQVLDQMADITGDDSFDAGGGDGNELGIYVSAKELATYLQSNDFLNASNNSGNSFTIAPLESADLPYGEYSRGFSDTGEEARFWDSLDSNDDHSQNFWNKFKANTNGTELNSINGDLDLGGSYNNIDTSLKAMHNKAYTFYRVTEGSSTVDVKISIIPLATDKEGRSDSALHTEATFDNHNDVFKIRVATYAPNYKNNPTSPSKVVDVILNRPVEREDTSNYEFAHAVLAGGDVDLQNFDTSAGPCAGTGGGTCLDTSTNGDVHTNGDFTVGSNGSVQGKVTATGSVNVNGSLIPSTTYAAGTTGDTRDSAGVTSRVSRATQSQSQIDEIPIPTMNTDTTTVDLTACVDSDPSSDNVRYENCILDADLDVNNNKSVEYVGTVHITGDVDIKGSQRCAATTAPCRIVVDGVMGVGGNGSSSFNSSQESLYIIQGTGASSGTDCLDIGGTPDATGSNGALFYINNENCETRVRGNAEFFGGIITKGTVSTVGNATNFGIQRDSDMSALRVFLVPDPLTKDDLFPAVISWKDVNTNKE